MENGWRIWFHHFDKNGKLYAGGVSLEKYKHKSSATRAAKKRWGNAYTRTKWVVSKTNPWAGK